MNLLKLLLIEDLREFSVFKGCIGLVIGFCVILMIVHFSAPVPPFLAHRFLIWYQFVATSSLKLLIYFLLIQKKTVASIPYSLMLNRSSLEALVGISMYVTLIAFFLLSSVTLFAEVLIMQDFVSLSLVSLAWRLMDSFIFAQISIALLLARLKAQSYSQLGQAFSEMIFILATCVIVAHLEPRLGDWQLFSFYTILALGLLIFNYASLVTLYK